MSKELSDLIEQRMKGVFVVEDGEVYKIIGGFYHEGHYVPEVSDMEGYCSSLNDLREVTVATPSQVRKYKSKERKNKRETNSKSPPGLYIPGCSLDNGVF